MTDEIDPRAASCHLMYKDIGNGILQATVPGWIVNLTCQEGWWCGDLICQTRIGLPKNEWEATVSVTHTAHLLTTDSVEKLLFERAASLARRINLAITSAGYEQFLNGLPPAGKEDQP